MRVLPLLLLALYVSVSHACNGNPAGIMPFSANNECTTGIHADSHNPAEGRLNFPSECPGVTPHTRALWSGFIVPHNAPYAGIATPDSEFIEYMDCAPGRDNPPQPWLARWVSHQTVGAPIRHLDLYKCIGTYPNVVCDNFCTDCNRQMFWYMDRGTCKDFNLSGSWSGITYDYGYPHVCTESTTLAS